MSQSHGININLSGETLWWCQRSEETDCVKQEGNSSLCEPSARWRTDPRPACCRGGPALCDGTASIFWCRKIPRRKPQITHTHNNWGDRTQRGAQLSETREAKPHTKHMTGRTVKVKQEADMKTEPLTHWGTTTRTLEEQEHNKGKKTQEKTPTED